MSILLTVIRNIRPKHRHVGVPCVCGRKQGFGTTSRTQRRASGFCSTTTSFRKKTTRTGTGIGGLALQMGFCHVTNRTTKTNEYKFRFCLHSTMSQAVGRAVSRRVDTRAQHKVSGNQDLRCAANFFGRAPGHPKLLLGKSQRQPAPRLMKHVTVPAGLPTVNADALPVCCTLLRFPLACWVWSCSRALEIHGRIRRHDARKHRETMASICKPPWVPSVRRRKHSSMIWRASPPARHHGKRACG